MPPKTAEIYVLHKQSDMESLKSIEQKIRKAMKQQNTYSKAMELSIGLAAGSYLAYLKAREDVENLDSCCTVRISRENNEYKVPHPEFKIMLDAAEQTRKYLRELRLTRATIESGSDEDEVDNLINAVEAEDAGEE